MRYLILIATLLLTSCTDSGIFIPDNTVSVAQEICKDLDGVKSLRVLTYYKSGSRYCGNDCNKLVTEVSIWCVKYDTYVVRRIEWERK